MRFKVTLTFENLIPFVTNIGITIDNSIAVNLKIMHTRRYQDNINKTLEVVGNCQDCDLESCITTDLVDHLVMKHVNSS